MIIEWYFNSYHKIDANVKKFQGKTTNDGFVIN